MAKKDFSQVNTGRVYSAIADATAEPQEAHDAQEVVKKRKPRKTYTSREAEEALQARQTSGRKDVKLPRINMAFSPSVYDYITYMSRVRGETMTDFVNLVLEQHMQDHMDVYQRAQEFINSL